MTCKIDRVADEYGLTSIDTELRGAKTDGASLRELETLVNHRLLKQAFLDAGSPLLPGEVDTLYDLLTDSEISKGTEIQLTDRLETEGIDADSLVSDFVSYQTVRTHLRDCLDVDTGRQQQISVETERQTVFGILGRTEQIVQDSVDRLAAAEVLDTGSVEVSVTARVTCESCAHSYSLDELLSQRGCACGDLSVPDQ
jgi:hypothetical protein